MLAPWLTATPGEAAESRLSQLLTTELEPVITGVIRFKLRLGAEAHEAEDLKQESLTELLGELQKCRHPGAQPIADVRALAATITLIALVIAGCAARRRNAMRWAISCNTC